MLSIKRLFLTYALLCISLIAFIFTAIILINGLQSRFRYVHENTLPSIIDISKMMGETSSLILLLYRHQNVTELSSQTQIESEISRVITYIKNLCQFYLKNEVSNNEDRLIMLKAMSLINQIEMDLPDFISGLRTNNDDIALEQFQDLTGVGTATHQLMTNFQNLIRLNINISNSLSEKNKWGIVRL